jgi:hypothetical protein
VPAAGVGILPDNLTCVVDAVGKGVAGGRRIVEGKVGGEGAAIRVVQEAMSGKHGVAVPPDDLARIVDVMGLGALGGVSQGIIDGGVSAAAIEEAVGKAAGDYVKPGDLAMSLMPKASVMLRVAEGSSRVV